MRSRARDAASTLLIVVLTIAVVFAVAWKLLGGFSESSSTGPAPTSATQSLTLTTETVTAPSKPATSPTARPATPALKAVNPLAGDVPALVNSRAGTISVAVKDLQTGRLWVLHPGPAQATASIVKVDIMATLLAQQHQGTGAVTSSQRATLANMIEFSDNTAATDLWNAVGGPSGIRSVNDQLGLSQTTPSTCLSCPGFPWPGWGLTTTTPTDQVALLEALVRPNALLSSAQQAFALGLMEQVTPSERWGVTAGVPATATVALKNGWVPLPSGAWQINSIGWIRGPGRNYLIAVLTTANPSESYGIDTIDAISTSVYRRLGQ